MPAKLYILTDSRLSKRGTFDSPGGHRGGGGEGVGLHFCVRVTPSVAGVGQQGNYREHRTMHTSAIFYLSNPSLQRSTTPPPPPPQKKKKEKKEKEKRKKIFQVLQGIAITSGIRDSTAA